MALTPSTMMALDTVAPDFELPDTISDQQIALQSIKSDIATVVMFICNHCPYVMYVQQELVNVANDYQPKGIQFVAISSNDVENYPEDSPEQMRRVATKFSYSFPYLYDETQEVAKAYDATCTPDIFIFDKDLKCAYRGQLDDARPGNDASNDGKDVRNALDAMIAGKSVDPDQKPSVGCNIKWKSGVTS